MKWREVFLPLTLRAFKRIHYNYSIWGLGQQLFDQFDLKKINQNHGLLLANETSVCDSITQEFINSPLTNGAYIDGQIRYYSIFREVDFSFDKSLKNRFKIDNKEKRTKTVDLLLNRYKLSVTERKISQIPVLIEAKRYHYFTPNIVTGEPEFKRTNENSIIEDVKYLRQIKANLSQLQFELKVINPETVFIYTLFWGLLNDTYKKKPSEIIKEKFEGYLNESDSYYEYLPIKWEGTTVKEWIWICLSQIDKVDRQEEESPFKDLSEVNAP